MVKLSTTLPESDPLQGRLVQTGSSQMNDLQQMLTAAVDRVKAMTPSERAAMYQKQRRSFMRAEASFGSDADEAAYSRAIAHGDEAEIARLEAEASARVDAVDKYLSDSKVTHD